MTENQLCPNLSSQFPFSRRYEVSKAVTLVDQSYKYKKSEKNYNRLSLHSLTVSTEPQ